MSKRVPTINTIMFLATPYRGRAIPFSFITYSSSTINSELSSRNMEHIKSIGELKEVLGDKILVLDREFSYELLFAETVEAGIQFVIQAEDRQQTKHPDTIKC